jgi:acetyl esterase/lipase
LFIKATDFTDFKTEDQIIEGVKVRIYSLKESSPTKTPVMVYYHGGAFVLGEIGYLLIILSIIKSIYLIIAILKL